MHGNLIAECVHVYITALSCIKWVLLQDVPQAILLKNQQLCRAPAEGKESCGFGQGDVLSAVSVKLRVPVMSCHRIILCAFKK